MKLIKNSIFTKSQVEQFRNETRGCQNVNHLNNAGAGLMPDIVTTAVLDYVRLESEIGGYESAGIKEDSINDFYKQAGLLFNCKPSNVAFTASATDSFTRALSSILFSVGDVILTDKDGYVSNQIHFLSLQKRLGVKIVHIKNSPDGGIDLADLEEKLKNYKPKLLSITHIPTNSGLVQPVEEIAKIYNEYLLKVQDRTWYILDACQSAGQMKLDVVKLRCDFLSVTCRKFLRGPRGTGALYISNRALNEGLEPLFIDMRGAEWTNKNSYKHQIDARRFEDWEFNYANVIGTSEAIKYCLNIGEDNIWNQVKGLSGYLRSRLLELDKVALLDKGRKLGGLVTFHVPGSKPEQIVQELASRKINVVASYRAFAVIDFDEKGVQWAVRASPHYYNTMEEIDYFVSSLKEIIKK